MNYETLTTADSVQKTIATLAERNIKGILVNNRAEALEQIKSFIPKDASVMN